MSVADFLQTVFGLAVKYLGTLATFARILAEAAERAPDLLAFVIAGVQSAWDFIAALKDSGASEEEIEATKDAARENLVTASMDKFHGSGKVFSESYVRVLVEAAFQGQKAVKLGPAAELSRDDLARAKGYLKSSDIDLAMQTYPQLFGIK